MDTWNTPRVQSRQPVTYRLMESMEATDRGLPEIGRTWLSTLMIDTWRSGVRSAMGAASQLPGRGSTDVDVAPVPAC